MRAQRAGRLSPGTTRRTGPMAVGQGLAVLAVDKEDRPVVEGVVELGQGEDDVVVDRGSAR